jgi:hypothetical protein
MDSSSQAPQNDNKSIQEKQDKKNQIFDEIMDEIE